MATAKKKAGAAKKAVTKKPSAKKPVKTPAKKAASGTKKATKPVARTQKSASKVASPKPSTSNAKNTTSAKKGGVKAPVVVKKNNGKPSPSSKTKSKPANAEATKPLPSKQPAKTKSAGGSIKPSKPVSSAAKSAAGKPKSIAPAPIPTKPAPAAKPLSGSSKSVAAKPAAGKAKQPDQQDPLHTKAQKAIRELEETMDLSKMRPRIQAGSPPPKPLPKKPQAFPKLPEPANTGGKVKYQLEFEFRSSPKILFTSLSDSSGLAGWFADEVHTKDDLFTFVWEGGESYARLIALHEPQLVRFQWLEDAADGTYFQFEIKEDDITSDIALIITDFAFPGEKYTNIRLWESQVQKLRMLLGSL